MVQQVAPGPSVAVQVLTIKPKTCTPGVRQTKRNTGSQDSDFRNTGSEKASNPGNPLQWPFLGMPLARLGASRRRAEKTWTLKATIMTMISI